MRKLCNAKIEHGILAGKNFVRLDVFVWHIVVGPKLNSANLSKFLYNIEPVFGEEIDADIFVEIKGKNICIDFLCMSMLLALLNYITKNNIGNYKHFTVNENDAKKLALHGFFVPNSCISAVSRVEADLMSIQPSESKDLIIYPQKISCNDDEQSQTIIDEYIGKIGDFYLERGMEDAIVPIACCVGEIVSNFWGHSKETMDTMIFVKGDRRKFYFCIIDNGVGIISSLKVAYPHMGEKELLGSSINLEVSSKLKVEGTGHMGRGLYLVSNIVKSNSGFLNIWSEGYSLHVDSGRKRLGNSGYWKGTIIELSFDLRNIVPIWVKN